MAFMTHNSVPYSLKNSSPRAPHIEVATNIEDKPSLMHPLK